MQSTPFKPFGLQTGNDDPSSKSSYATSMVYNDHNQEVTIIGGSYSDYFRPGVERDDEKIGSDCFIAVQDLRHNQKLSWVRRRQYGDPSVQEFCSDIHLREGGRYIALGYADEDSVLSRMLPNGDIRRSVYGMVIDLDENIQLDGGILLHSNEVQYPIAVTTDRSGDEIFVAEIFSDTKPEDFQVNSMLSGSLDGVGEDASATAYAIPAYGLSFSVRLQKLTSINNLVGATRQSGVSESFHSEWSREYGTVDMDNVQVSTIEYISPSILLMTGFTRGQGEAFGEPSDSSTGTLDGFVMTVDPSSGQMLRSKRIESSVLPGDDRILGTCLGNSINEVYIVGMTEGLFDSTYIYKQEDRSTEHHVYAFIQKVELDEMRVVWSRQVGAIFNGERSSDDKTSPQVHALACAVTPDGEEVFMAGNVKDGASLVMPTGQSFLSGGGNDVFVTKFGTEEGNLMFAAQIGSEGDDSLASKKSLSTDSDGNLIILGNTNGSMYRKRSQPTANTDIFTMSVGRERGDFISPFDSMTKTEELSGGSFFGHRYEDPVQQARYENIMAALLTLLCLVFVLLCCFQFLYWRKAAHELEKGSAVEKATIETCHSSSEDSNSTDSHPPLRSDESFSIGAYGRAKGFVRPSLEIKPSPLIVPESKRGISRGVSKYSDSENDSTFSEDAGSIRSIIGKHPEFSDDLGSIRSIIGKHRANPFCTSIESLTRSLSTETERNQSSKRKSSESKRKDDLSGTYGEIYDLLSRASDRLGLNKDDDAIDDSYLDTPTTAKSRRKPWCGKKEEDMTLEEIWNMQVV